MNDPDVIMEPIRARGLAAAATEAAALRAPDRAKQKRALRQAWIMAHYNDFWREASALVPRDVPRGFSKVRKEALRLAGEAYDRTNGATS